MEHLLQKSKRSIFHNIFKYMIFQIKASKGVIMKYMVILCILEIHNPGNLANGKYTDEMPQSVTFHQGLHCFLR